LIAASMFFGAMFLPPAVMMISFFRPVICKKPSASNAPRSPEYSHPSRSVSAVAAGSLKYPKNTFGPRTRISSSSAIRTSTPGTAGPTVPKRKRSGRLKLVGPVSSDCPYTSSTTTSSCAKNSSTSLAIGAAPLTQIRAAPRPIAGFSFAKISRFAAAYCSASSPRGSPSPAILAAFTAPPTPIAHVTSAFFSPVAWLNLAEIPAWNFSQIRGTPKNTVGCTSFKLSATRSSDSAKYTAPPTEIGTWIENICSAICDSGRYDNIRSALLIPPISRAEPAVHARFAWDSITPFGGPVVPDV
jgi:hypothetical protein